MTRAQGRLNYINCHTQKHALVTAAEQGRDIETRQGSMNGKLIAFQVATSYT